MLELKYGGAYLLQEDFFDADSAREMGEKLLREFSFEQRSILLFGREVLQPRLISWAGDAAYSYSGDTLVPRAWGPCATQVKERVNAFLREVAPSAPPFNHVLANHYRDGADSMGMHADDEAELGKDPWIASLSFGVARTFVLRSKGKGREADRVALGLTSGALLLMAPPTQRYYLHGVPKQRAVSGSRLNLTFRAVSTAGG